MTSPSLSVSVLLAVAVVLCHESEGFFQGDGNTSTKSGVNQPQPPCVYACGMCGDPIQVTLVVMNDLIKPTFEYNVTLSNQHQRELIYFLEKAAQTNSQFMFSASYNNKWGYFLTKIGGQDSGQIGDTYYYWKFTDLKTGKALQKGLSSYVPDDQGMILFNLTTYDNGH